MSLRTVTLLILAASLIYLSTFVPEISHTATDILYQFSADTSLILVCILSAVLLILGHLVRAFRDTILFSKAAKTTTQSQFAAFSVGSLCNAVLPLRIGELMRADILAQKYSISFSFSFILICAERLVDSLILGAAALIFIGFNFVLALVALLLFVLLLFIYRPPLWIKKLITALSSLLNEKLEAKVLFTFWTVEYGLRRTFTARLVIKYLVVSIMNWILYFAALIPAILYITGSSEVLRLSIGTYVSLSTSLAPGALGDYTNTFASLIPSVRDLEPIILWIIAIIPTALIGLGVAIFSLEQLPLFRSTKEKREEKPDNKLSRNSDISSDQIEFMKDYYSGKKLAMKIAKEEMTGNGHVLSRYFTSGGSKAITFQSTHNGKDCVTKVVGKENAEMLKTQYVWLKEHKCDGIATVLNESEDESSYLIDIEYEDSSIDAMEYIHSHSLDEGKALFDAVVSILDENVWKTDHASLVAREDASELLDGYINKHIIESLNIASSHMSKLKNVMNCSTLIINGVSYSNLDELLARINKGTIREDLCSYKESDSIHGDLICDNIIYSERKHHAIILDPVSDGNFFNGPVFDFGKLSQSLQIGYEFLLRDSKSVDVVFLDHSCIIQFADKKSVAFDQLWQYIYNELAPAYLSESELRTVLFIGATNYFRRMKHQVIQCPENAIKFYAQGIRYLSDYVNLFRGQ